ncbi:sulfated surface-like glycoprotein [Carex rostrata]
MATGWVRSLQCKSNVLDDVASTPKKLNPRISLSCTTISKESVFILPKQPSNNPKSQSTPKPRRKRKPVPVPFPPSPLAPSRHSSSSFLSLTELPEGHSSRRVVEIIFNSSWSSGRTEDFQFAGKIEMMFRVHNPARTVARFEECRNAVRARAHFSKSADSRCAADGNEMMRFHCRTGTYTGTGTNSEPVYDAGVTRCKVMSAGRMLDGVRTYTKSREAHDSAGGGSGRWAMLVCRVVAGRVGSGSESDGQCDSVSIGKGELVVFDQRAVLPCFLIIYKV